MPDPIFFSFCAAKWLPRLTRNQSDVACPNPCHTPRGPCRTLFFLTFCALWPDLCKMGPKSAPGGSKFEPGGSRIDPGGSKIDPRGFPKRPRRLKNRHRRLLEGSWVFLGGSSGVPGGSWGAFLQENAPFWRSKIDQKVRFFDVF